MLPVTFQFIIAMVAYSLNERMARQLDYLLEEVRVLKEALDGATGKKRIDFTAEQRRRLAPRRFTQLLSSSRCLIRAVRVFGHYEIIIATGDGAKAALGAFEHLMRSDPVAAE